MIRDGYDGDGDDSDNENYTDDGRKKQKKDQERRKVEMKCSPSNQESSTSEGNFQLKDCSAVSVLPITISCTGHNKCSPEECVFLEFDSISVSRPESLSWISDQKTA